MKLAISNIAWSINQDEEMYGFIADSGFSGIEIAPTRLFQEKPYSNMILPKKFAEDLKTRFNLTICSMQSILYGKTEKLFGSGAERSVLLDYSRKAIDFASIISCGNLVFGSPKNRIIEIRDQYPVAIDFFRSLGEYAFSMNTVLSIEANPTIYGTNFINTTEEAFLLAKEVNSAGFRVNVDLGTVIQNAESLLPIMENIGLVNHVHISEPNLVTIVRREIHIQLCEVLDNLNYNNYVSIEMRNLDNLDNVKQCMEYVRTIFDHSITD